MAATQTGGALGGAGQESTADFRLTPFLQMGSTPSPWSLIDWNKVPGTTPTPTAASIHKLERNQFETSFVAAICDPAAEEEPDGSAVPQMTMPKVLPRGGYVESPSDRVVPTSAPATRKARGGAGKAKSTGGKAGKTAKVKSAPAAAAPSSTKKRTALSDKQRREKRREQNRRNAAKCRQRKLDKVSVLTDQLDDLRDENDDLKEELAEMEARVANRVA
eukprot:m.86032 g.86032  ORF g.86032 m.86032 type:complete len:219 (-) comp19813_c0_seq1:218-874(-)